MVTPAVGGLEASLERVLVHKKVSGLALGCLVATAQHPAPADTTGQAVSESELRLCGLNRP